MRKSVETYKKMFVDPSRLKSGTPDMPDAKHIVWAALKRHEKLAGAKAFIEEQVGRRTKKLNNAGWDATFVMPLAEFSGFVTVDNSNFEHVVETRRGWKNYGPGDSHYTDPYPLHCYRWKEDYWNSPIAIRLRDDVRCDGEAEDVVDWLLDGGWHTQFSFHKNYPCNIYDWDGVLKPDEWIENAMKQPHTITMNYRHNSGGAAGNDFRFEREAKRYADACLTIWALFRMLDVQPFEPKPESELYAPTPVVADHFAEQQKQLLADAQRLSENASEEYAKAQQKIGYFQQLEVKIKKALKKR